ncbi:MAG TPA: MBL fold metallo-hydrolase [Steroidobacter sp.]|jgi:glyoxylase-like metal-dependent hydrolase (beta-lactamase superfamily II)|nr:MBL fold metallo-hydrolase [Steroidobacter sp.]
MLTSGQIDVIVPGVRRLVARNPGYMTGPGTNTYLIGAERFVVVDPGPVDEVHVGRILEETSGRIDAVMATHTHPDHSPCVEALARASGAQVLGRPAPPHGRQDATFAPVRVLSDGDVVRIDAYSLRTLHTPGHASNHLCFLLEGAGLLFSGDHLMEGSTVVISPPDGDMKQYLGSLERLQHEPIASIAPGHGEIIEDAQREISAVIAHRLKREAKALERLRQAVRTNLETLVISVYDDVDPRLHPIAQSSLLAHLLKLEQEGRVWRDDEAHWMIRE